MVALHVAGFMFELSPLNELGTKASIPGWTLNGKQHSASNEAQTCNPMISSQARYRWGTILFPSILMTLYLNTLSKFMITLCMAIAFLQ